MQELVVAPRRVGRAFQPDDAGKLVLIFGRDLQHDRAAHRAAHHHRLLECELEPHGADHREIALRRQAVLLQPPAVGRCRAAVIRQVERDDAKPVGDLRIVEHMAVLPRVRARGVQAQQRHALPGFLDMHAICGAVDIDRRDSARRSARSHSTLGAPVSRMMFIIRCSARAFCMAIRLSPSSTNSGTRISMAKKS